MKRVWTWVWGLVLIALGVIWGLNALGVADINVFFPGWWTLFIIVPSVVGLFTENHKVTHLIGLLIGGCLLLGCWGVVGFDMVWKLVLPVALVMIGCAIIFKSGKSRETMERIKVIEADDGEREEHWATFGEKKLDYEGKEFTGCEVEAIFGGVEVDLRKAKVKNEALIKVSSIFGGVKIWMPEGVKVEVVSTSVFGGVSDARKSREGKKSAEREGKDGAKELTVYVEAGCVFGGVEIL